MARAQLWAWLLFSSAVVPTAGIAAEGSLGFDPIYQLLETRCGECHVQGVADGPWSLNTPPGPDRYPDCLSEKGAAALRCATWHELVQPPGPGIPAWIRPEDAQGSEPYAQACVPEVSFHIGHSLPASLSESECSAFLQWIKAGARR